MRSDGMSIFLSMLHATMPGSGTFFLHEIFEELFDAEHELAPHPLIDDLKHWDLDLRRLQTGIPRPIAGVRPHSCVFSHMIGAGLKAKGYTYISQSQQLYDNQIRPLRHPWGIWELPLYYMDNMDFWMCENWPTLGHKPFAESIIDAAVSSDNLFVFDFHPLHIALNSSDHKEYQAAKPFILGDPAISPFTLANSKPGTRDFFERLCYAMKMSKLRSHTLSEALAHYCENPSPQANHANRVA